MVIDIKMPLLLSFICSSNKVHPEKEEKMSIPIEYLDAMRERGHDNKVQVKRANTIHNNVFPSYEFSKR